MNARALRRDAAENRSRILDAARSTFDQEGLDAGMEVIAQRAGVGVGTIYRRFPTKEDLIASVVHEVLSDIRDAQRSACEADDAGEGFLSLLFDVGEIYRLHLGCLPRLWGDADDELREEIDRLGREVLERAQRDGAVRKDVVYEDLVTLFWSLRGVIERSGTVSPDAWRRALELQSQAWMFCNAPLRTAPPSSSDVALIRGQLQD